MIWLAALSVMSSNFSAGMLLAFLSYKEQFSQRIAVLIDRIFELRILRLHGERVADILLTATEQDTEAAEAELHDLIVNIELRNVSFRYAKDEPDIINDLSLMIPAGECIVITGASGCGKTTLLKLLLGLLKPTKGGNPHQWNFT
ncbi:ATP-binding cassette domain-containing protein [Pseudomonas asplenii]|uniref:ATP-binding cassette domain-containing protein n=1 Tax=Pseudomonas asplenii TaxID=53407 RepID=UPI001955AF20|nr:ATP-binding cassette domain-containing protein [Pseudomonas fuscovaginae]